MEKKYPTICKLIDVEVRHETFQIKGFMFATEKIFKIAKNRALMDGQKQLLVYPDDKDQLPSLNCEFKRTNQLANAMMELSETKFKVSKEAYSNFFPS